MPANPTGTPNPLAVAEAQRFVDEVVRPAIPMAARRLSVHGDLPLSVATVALVELLDAPLRELAIELAAVARAGGDLTWRALAEPLGLASHQQLMRRLKPAETPPELRHPRKDMGGKPAPMFTTADPETQD